MDFQKFCREYLSRLPQRSLFLSVRGYQNNWGEIADHLVGFHVNYQHTIQKSLNVWQDFIPTPTAVVGHPFSLNDLIRAKEELIHSYTLSLTPPNPYYTNVNTYAPVRDSEGKIIRGVKIHRSENILHLEGYRLMKRIIRPAVPNHTQSSSLTLAKRWLREQAPVGRWGQWVLLPGRFIDLRTQQASLFSDQWFPKK